MQVSNIVYFLFMERTLIQLVGYNEKPIIFSSKNNLKPKFNNIRHTCLLITYMYIFIVTYQCYESYITVMIILILLL